MTIINQTLEDLIDLANEHQSPTRHGVREAKLAKIVAEQAGSAQNSDVGAGKLPLLALAEYNFATNGGAVGTISLGVTIPDNSYVMGVSLEVVTAPTSAGDTGTLVFSLPTDGALTAPPMLADGAATSSGIAAAAVKTTADRVIQAVIGTEPITAGRVRIAVLYAPSV